MGNSLGGKNKKTTKVMKITGETLKLKTPVKAEEVIKDYPRHVLLESEAVKHFGIRAKPLQPQQDLEAKRLYFLVELPADVAKEIVPRRVRSEINYMSAKDRLESLMLSRRSVSDLSIMKPMISSSLSEEGEGGGGGMRLKMKLPRAEVEKLMKESKTDDEIAQKIRDLCMADRENQQQQQQQKQQQIRWNNNHNNNNGKERFKKRVSFKPISEGGSQITVAS